MTLKLSKPILYLITRGATAETTTPESEEFQNILKQVLAAVSAGIHLVQIREKELTAQRLFELAARAVSIAQGSSTRILINDRADIAAGAGAHGVHLTTRSLTPDIVRQTFGPNFLIGASTHSLSEVQAARNEGADFAVFGPIFPTPAKKQYGDPLGPGLLAQAARELAPFPLLALGGISIENMEECLSAGASGIAGISIFARTEALVDTVETLKRSWPNQIRLDHVN
jgi:thiamine-phosphate pyrophosphorylase